MGDFMLNPNLLYHLQSQSFYCLGRIIGISIRCCVPLHFALPRWLWRLISNMCRHSNVCAPNDAETMDLELHLQYLREFDLTLFRSLESLRNAENEAVYVELFEMLSVATLMLSEDESNDDLLLR